VVADGVIEVNEREHEHGFSTPRFYAVATDAGDVFGAGFRH
jgi:hypothetical protein